MTPRGAAGAVAFIALRWVHPDITADPQAMAAIAADLSGYDDAEVMAALERLVAEGHRWQPRGPEIIATITRMRGEQAALRRSMEADESVRRLIASRPDPSPPSSEVLDLVARLKADATMPRTMSRDTSHDA